MTNGESLQDEIQKMGLRTSQINLSSFGCGLTLLVIFWMLGAVGLGWLVKSFVLLVLFILMTPAIAFLGFRWWLQRNLVEDECPVCNHKFTGLNETQLRCPRCSEPLQVEGGHFKRLTPPGTIDVQAVEVSATNVEE